MKFTTLEKILALMVVATILMTIVISFVPNFFCLAHEDLMACNSLCLLFGG